MNERLRLEIRRLDRQRPSRSSFMVIDDRTWNRIVALTERPDLEMRAALDAYHASQPPNEITITPIPYEGKL